MWQRRYVPFDNVGKCPFVVCKLFDTWTNLASNEISTIQHTDHKLANSWAICPGMPTYMQNVALSSPTCSFKVCCSSATGRISCGLDTFTCILKLPSLYPCSQVFVKRSTCIDIIVALAGRSAISRLCWSLDRARCQWTSVNGSRVQLTKLWFHPTMLDCLNSHGVSTVTVLA